MKHKSERPNGWAVLRDVLIQSINKGQFAVAVLGVIVLFGIFKMPPNEVGGLVKEVLKSGRDDVWASYITNVLLVIGWFVHSRYQRRSLAAEMERIGLEKSKLQEQLLGKNLASGKKKK